MGEGGRDEEVASFKKKTNWRLEYKNRYPIYDQNGGKMAKIDTQFMTDQNGWKTIPFGAAHTYKPHIREYPPGTFRLTSHRITDVID